MVVLAIEAPKYRVINSSEIDKGSWLKKRARIDSKEKKRGKFQDLIVSF